MQTCCVKVLQVSKTSECLFRPDLLSRIWQYQLCKCCPIWVASGVCPDATRAGRQSWKVLVKAASQAQVMQAGKRKLAAPERLTQRTKQLWDSGRIASQDEYICALKS